MTLPQQLQITPPPGFLEEEAVTSWRTAAVKDLKDPRVTQFQVPVRPNLIVTQRVVSEAASLAKLMSKVCADLIRHVEGISNIETTEFEFADGTPGLLLRYTMPVHGKFTVLQLQAGRMDGAVFSTLTFSTEASRATDEDLAAYLTCIATAAPKAA